MESMRKRPKKELLEDIKSLAAYAPRAQAIKWIFEGRFDRFMDWAAGDGRQAATGQSFGARSDEVRYSTLTEPLWLDQELLFGRIMKGKERTVLELSQRAFYAIDLFGQSPLEMLLRGGSDEAFDAFLRFLISPKARFALRGYSDNAFKAAWGSWNMKLTAQGNAMLRFMLERDSAFMILPLAVMIGRRDRADLMLKRGVQPNDWQRMDSDVFAMRELPADFLADLTGAQQPNLVAASEWVEAKCELSERLSEIAKSFSASSESRDEARREAASIAEQGVAINYYPMALASEAGDAELVKCFFANGGDPNCRYKSGAPMLAALDASKLGVDVLQAWLDAGANPAMPLDMDTAFGGSALENFVFRDRIDLVEKSCDGAAGKVELRSKFEGKTYSSLLSLALSKGDADMALLLMRLGGCKLSDRDESTGRPCSSFGSPALIADIKSELENKSLRVSTPEAKEPPKTLVNRTDTL